LFNPLKLEVLLYQSGYLTIKEVQHYEEYEITEYELGVPNKEVQISLNNLFFEYFTQKKIDSREKLNLLKALKEANLEEFKNILISLFASIPYNNYVKNNIASYEGYYASVIYAYLASLGLPIIAEDVTNKSRIDLAIKFENKIYIIEFKVKKDIDNVQNKENIALKQIKEKKYYEKYLNENKEIYLIGIVFDENERNIVKFDWEKV